MAVSTHFYLTPDDEAFFQRVEPETELEVRLSSINYMNQFTSLTKETYETILNGLKTSPYLKAPDVHTPDRFQEYINTVYSIPNSKLASLRETVWIQPLRESVVIRKEKVNRENFRKQFHGFELRMTESIEKVGRLIGGEEKTMKRHIWRDKVEVQLNGLDYLYDCSVVESTDLKKPSSLPVVTYEVELELPLTDKLAEYARVGISYLLELMFQPFSLDKRFLFKGLDDIKNDIAVVKRMTYIKEKFQSVKPFELNIRNDPVNLKRKHIPSLNDFAMTNKLDGERRLIVGLGRQEALILHPNGYMQQKVDSAYYITLPFVLPFMVLDTEFYQGTFYIFDVIQPPSLKEQSPMINIESAHQNRMGTLSDDKLLMNALLQSSMKAKTFYYGSLYENLQAFINQNPAKEWFDHNDGLIFTQKNASYINANHYKFKFTSKMSIDFAVFNQVALKSGQSQYNLGVSRFNRATKSNTIVPFKNATLTTFSVYPAQSIFECIYLPAYQTWSILRPREDKTYPNAELTAESVYEDIVSPISLKDLYPDISENYLRQIEKEERLFQTSIYFDKKQLLNHFFDLDLTAFIYMCSAFFGTDDQRYKDNIYHNMCKFFAREEVDESIIKYISGIPQKTESGIVESSIAIYESKLEVNSLESYLHSILKNSPYQPLVFDARTWSDIDHTKLHMIPKIAGYRDIKNVPLKENPDIVLGTFEPSIVKLDNSYDDYVTVEDHSDPKNIRKISQYSSLMPWHKKQVTQIMTKWFPNPVSIADLTANIGVDVIHMASLYPEARIEAFEIEPTFHKALVMNVNKMKATNVKPYFLDSNYALQLFIENQFTFVYIDAPWGGKIDTKTAPPPTDLFLQAEADKPKKSQFNIKSIACYLLYKKKITKAVVIKVPTFYKSNDLEALFNVEKEEVINDRNNKVSYVLYKLTALEKISPIQSPSTIVLWSLPYVDQVDRLFQLTTSQKHLIVRVPIDLIYERSAQLFYQYHLLPFSSEMNVIDYYEVVGAAARNNYQLVNHFDARHPSKPQAIIHRYFHFVSNALLVAPAPQQVPQQVASVSQQVVPAPRQQLQTVAQQQSARVFSQPSGPRTFPKKCVINRPQIILSSTDHMRRYHNNEKRILINMFCRNRSVLDLGAGYGGDLHKYSACNVSRLVLVEPNDENINRQDEPEGLLCRIEKSVLKDKISVVQAYGQDTDTIIQQEIIPNGRVEVVASFFSLTFLFESRQVLRNFLNTINSCLIEGGYFIGTMMEGEKTFQQFKGKKQMTLGTAEMIKQYTDESKLPKGDTGMKLWINIKDTIVKNQDEYLAFFEVLVEEAARFGMELKLIYDFDPSRYYEYENIEQGDRTFSKLCVGFAFRKMPKSLDSFIYPLKVDSTFDFINLYGEMTPMIRTGVISDGSCFYHAFLYNTDESYRLANTVERTATVKKLRSDFASQIQPDMYLNILTHELYHLLHQMKGQLFTKDELNAFESAIPADFFTKEKFLSQLRTLDDSILILIKKVIDDEVKKLKVEIANPSTWADEKHIPLFMNVKKMNIYFIDSITRRPTQTFFTHYKTGYRYSTVIFVINDSHYEPLGFVRNKKAYRMLTAFDPSLILVHHWLIKKVINEPSEKIVEEQKGNEEQKVESEEQKVESDERLEELLFNYKEISNPEYMIQSVVNDADFKNLLNKFSIKPDLRAVRKDSDDRSIVTYLKGLAKPKQENQVVATARQKNKINKGKAIAEMIPSQFKGSVENYLDIGCSDGVTTVAIGRKLGLSKDHIYGIDVEDFAAEPIRPDTTQFQFSRYRADEMKLPYADETFDVITLLVTLHHVNHPVTMLKEIKRILKPNGIVLFREHDRVDEKVDKLIRLEHLFYSQIDHQVDFDEYMRKKSERYFSKTAFIRVMEMLSFKKVDESNVREINNPTKLYYIMFTK